MIDVSDTLAAKSDQLNSDDLIGREVTVKVTNVTKVAGDQPVSIAITGGHQPWKPCKTMRRVLVAGWGADASAWIGRWLVLYRDPAVRFGGDAVGGVRIRAMSDIRGRVTISLAASKGKKAVHTIEVLKPPVEASAQSQAADLCASFDAARALDALPALDAERARLWPALAPADTAKLKTASEAAKARLSTVAEPPPITPEEAADIQRREADENKGVGD